MMTSDYPNPSFCGDFLPVERVCHARYTSSAGLPYNKGLEELRNKNNVKVMQ